MKPKPLKLWRKLLALVSGLVAFGVFLYATGDFLDGYFQRLNDGYSNDESMTISALEVGTSFVSYGMPDCGAANLAFDATIGMGLELSPGAVFTTHDTKVTAKRGIRGRASGGGIPSGYNSRKTSFSQLSVL